MSSNYEPRIVGFLCKWCAYTGADLAGTSRIKYPPNVTPIRVMCSGRVDPVLVMKALSSGADGVLIAGCHPGDCHYTSGNVKTIRRFKLLQKILDQFGVERDRVRLEWVSASEGEKYAQVVENMTETLRTLGPLNWNGDKEAS
jgi:F420-non-reducing hydrogenase iron-sulfur subunit